MYLTADIRSAVNKKLRASKGDKVTVVSTHGHVAIVKKEDQLFSVEVIYLSNVKH